MDDKLKKEEQAKRYEQYYSKKIKGTNDQQKLLFNIKEDMKYFTDKKGGILKFLGESFYNAANNREKQYIEEELLR